MNNNMIECPKCGNVQPSDSEKCFKCGFRLNSYLDYLEAINAEVNGSSGERIKTPYDEINKEKSDLRNKDTSKSLIHNPFFIVGILLIMISLGSLIMFAIDTDWFKNVPEEDRKNRIDEENYKKALQNIKEGFITVSGPKFPYEVKEFSQAGTLSKKGEIIAFKVLGERLNGDGTMTASYIIEYEMTYNSQGKEKKGSSNIVYIIRDSSGTVVSNSSILIGELSQGETVEKTGYLDGNFELGGKYYIEFYDTE